MLINIFFSIDFPSSVGSVAEKESVESCANEARVRVPQKLSFFMILIPRIFYLLNPLSAHLITVKLLIAELLPTITRTWHSKRPAIFLELQLDYDD